MNRRMLVADGNFSAEHMIMKHPERDVALADGESYTVKSEPYEEHLRLSTDDTEVGSLMAIAGSQ